MRAPRYLRAAHDSVSKIFCPMPAAGLFGLDRGEGGNVTDKGSIPAGPSDQYLLLLKGEITPEEYAKSVKKRVDARPNGKEAPSAGTAAQRQPT